MEFTLESIMHREFKFPQINAQFQNREILTIIITLFQEDNIFGMYVSLTYGPQLQM